MEVRPMKQPKVKKQKEWGFDPNARYNEYMPENFTKEYYEQLAGNKKNAWTKHMLNKDYKYDPKMMDPRYAAMKGAKRGLKAYFGDVNNDGVADVALVDENGKIKCFNGFTPKQSKRRQLVNYYSQVGPEKLTPKGSPIYPGKANFDAWVQQTATYEKNNGNLTKLNRELGNKGYEGYKLKEKTVTERIRTDMKPVYVNLINLIAQQNRINVAIVKKIMPYNLFIPIYTRVVLNTLFNGEPDARSDSETGKWIAKTLKRKWSESPQFAELKQLVYNVFRQLSNHQIFVQIGNQIWVGFNQGLDSIAIQVNIMNQFAHQIADMFTGVCNIARAAIQARKQIPSKRIVSNRPVPMNKQGSRRFNTSQVNGAYVIDDD